jgi:phage major head subunit gpT-like protein
MIVRQLLPDLNLTSMLPAIDEVVMGKYSSFPAQFPSIYRMKGSKRSIEQTTEVTGLGTIPVVGEGVGVRYDTPLPGFRKTYLHLQYGLGFKVTKIAMDNDQFSVFRRLSVELAKSANETREISAAYNFNRGFDSGFPGPDGVPLFSDSHPLVGGGLQSNVLAVAADPDVDSVRLILTLMRRTKNHRGLRQRIVPKMMILPPELEFVGAELLGGDQRSDTANRAINAFKRRSAMASFESWCVWDYLDDAHAWFVQADPEETELRWYDREAFNTVHGVDFESRSLKTAGWMQFSCGWNGFFGVAGAPSS